MPDEPQIDHRSAELDPDLLATAFEIPTKWHVITGAPCCGKTTLINLLAREGFRISPEAARQIIEQEMARGQGTHPLRVNAAALQRCLKAVQFRLESELPANEVLFLDVALPSSLAWYRVFAIDPNEILLDCFRHRYASVFLLDPLPFQHDAERVEEVADIAGYLDEWQYRDYTSLGYPVQRVPVLPPEERLAFVLDKLSERDALP